MAYQFWDLTNALSGKTVTDHPWDHFVIGSQVLPGICEVSVSADRRFDEKKHQGSDGEMLTIHGRNPARVEVAIRIWTDQQLQALSNIMLAIWPQYGKTGQPGTSFTIPSGIAGLVASQVLGVPAASNQSGGTTLAFDVQHPATTIHGVRAVSVVNFTGPVKGSAVGEKVFILRCIEYMPVRKSNSKPKAVNKSGSPPLTPAFTAATGPGGTPAPAPSANAGDTGPNFTSSTANQSVGPF